MKKRWNGHTTLCIVYIAIAVGAFIMKETLGVIGWLCAAGFAFEKHLEQ